jgi:hypothetical protein
MVKDSLEVGEKKTELGAGYCCRGTEFIVPRLYPIIKFLILFPISVFKNALRQFIPAVLCFTHKNITPSYGRVLPRRSRRLLLIKHIYLIISKLSRRHLLRK